MANSGQTRSAAAGGDSDPRLGELRRRIDEIDSRILEQLNERARAVVEVGERKRETGGAVYVPDRELRILVRLESENGGPFPTTSLLPVFREIISATRSLEAEFPIAYFGPAGTFTHLAAQRQFGESASLTGEQSIPDVFTAVERGRARVGVVPIENTTEGVVARTLDCFAESDLSISGETVLRISLDLFSRTGRAADVKRVVSHQQPLAQCRLWLDQHLPGVPREETASTAVAAQLAADEAEVAAIGSAIAGRTLGLQTIQSGIEDRRDNTTRFLLIGRQQCQPTGNDLTSALFTIRKDAVGGLHRLIEPMARRGVNLTALHLRPIAGKPWEYYFFIDLEGHRDDAEVASALAEAAEVAHSHRVLGSFPRATAARGAPASGVA